MCSALLVDGLYRNKAFVTTGVDEYQKLSDDTNGNCHVFVKLDAEAKTISFKLGNMEKTMQIVERTCFVSKVVGEKLYCVSCENLSKHMADRLQNPRFILIARTLLDVEAPYGR